MAHAESEKRTRRDCVIPPIRCTDDELATIRARSVQAGMSLSAYIRRVAIEGVTIERTPMADKALVAQLSALGNNINQLARSANIAGRLDRRTKPRLHDALDTLEHLIERLIE